MGRTISGSSNDLLVRGGGRLQRASDGAVGFEFGGSVYVLRKEILPEDGAHGGRSNGKDKLEP
jgi:hypothetical protein